MDVEVCNKWLTLSNLLKKRPSIGSRVTSTLSNTLDHISVNMIITEVNLNVILFYGKSGGKPKKPIHMEVDVINKYIGAFN